MEPLTINNLAPYFPGLKCFIKYDKETIWEIIEMSAENLVATSIKRPYTVRYDFADISPICFSLDNLTKPITINGETFVPIDELYFKSAYDKKLLAITADKNIDADLLGVINLRLSEWQKLFEWKFAINLPEGSWIPVTEEFNPYK